jgi:RNA-directed DNA polymerase
MSRWSPNSYLTTGKNKGYSEEYLKSLVATGRDIQSKKMPVVFTLSHLAHCSHTLYDDLHQFVSRKNSSEDYPYRSFYIRKRSGGWRKISVSAKPLFAVQKWITENIFSAIEPHHCSAAYFKGCSPKRNAEKHCQSDWLLKLDIKDFFGSISERQVYYCLKGLNYPSLLSLEIARLCTTISHKNKGRRWKQFNNKYNEGTYFSKIMGCLPQGAPSSPALSNLICKALDEKIYQLSSEIDATYTRYADDMCFSMSNTNRGSVIQFRNKVIEEISKYGFQINSKKTAIRPPGSRKIITGLTVNSDEPKLPKELKNKIRAHLYYCDKYNIPEHCEKKGFRSIVGFHNHLQGLITHALSIDDIKGAKYLEAFNNLPWKNYGL